MSLVALLACASVQHAQSAQECFELSYGEWSDRRTWWGVPVVPDTLRLQDYVRGAPPAARPLTGYTSDPEWARVQKNFKPQFTRWRTITPELLVAHFSTGYGGLLFRLTYDKSGLNGEVQGVVDDHLAPPSPWASVSARPIPCPQG